MSNERAKAPSRKGRGDYPELWGHHEVGHLIRATDSYIVYVDKEGDLDWETSAARDKELRERGHDAARHTALLASVALLERRPCEGLPVHTRREFLVLVGEALVCALELDHAQAEVMLRSAEAFLRARMQELSRRWYLYACFWAVTPCLVGVLTLWLARDWFRPWLGPTVFWLLIGSGAGSLGALFSVISRSGQLNFDCAAGKTLHTLEGTSRILVGCISGVFASLAVQSEFILAPIARSEHRYLTIALAALVAGAGERLVASIISTFETTHPALAAGEDVAAQSPSKEDPA